MERETGFEPATLSLGSRGNGRWNRDQWQAVTRCFGKVGVTSRAAKAGRWRREDLHRQRPAAAFSAARFAFR